MARWALCRAVRLCTTAFGTTVRFCRRQVERVEHGRVLDVPDGLSAAREGADGAAGHGEQPRSSRGRAKSRRYLKPVLGCLRRNRRRVFAAAVTRYLKSCPHRSAGRHRDLPRRRASGAQRRKVTGRTGGRVARSSAISTRYLCMQSEDARSPRASRSGAQGRLRPEHRKRRGSSAARARESHYGEQRTVRGQGRPHEVFG